METYILILTLAISGGNGKSGIGGVGGVAMAEFTNKTSCEAAAKSWLDRVKAIKPLHTGYSNHGKNNTKIAFCMPK